MPAKGEKYYFISSLAKGIKVLEFLADQEDVTVTQVANHLQTNRASSHRFLSTLRELGYVEKGDGNRYRLTFKILELGLSMASRSEVRETAQPYMQELSIAFGETINLGFIDGTDILHIDKIEGREILRVDSTLGSRAPLYCTGLGKAILFTLPKNVLQATLNNMTLKPQGPNTITSKVALKKELEISRRRGYAIDDEELSSGLRCVAAPIIDHSGRAFYAISISGPAFRMTHERIEEIQPVLRSACHDISRKTGSQSS